MEHILAVVLIFGGGIVIALGFSPIGRAVAERLLAHQRDADRLAPSRS